MIVRGIPFNARLTLIDSAQTFVWHEETDGFRAPVGDRNVVLNETTVGFDVHPVLERDIPFFTRYFDLDRPYDALKTVCVGRGAAEESIKALEGLRVLNQPSWDTLLMFITSANNHVQRIRSLVKKLIELGNGLLPTPEKLAQTSEKTLRTLGFGYRARYLPAAARLVADGFPLDELKNRPYSETHKRLLELPGVGDKVADCVQLFGMGQTQAFPVDVWVERLMVSWYGAPKGNKQAIRQMAWDLFGEQAGLVQQYLFHCARMGLIQI